MRLDWRSDLNDRYSLILALKEEIFLGHPAVDLENETMADLGLQRKFGKATYAALSFRANDGGLAGFASEHLFGNGGTTYETALILRHVWLPARFLCAGKRRLFLLRHYGLVV